MSTQTEGRTGTGRRAGALIAVATVLGAVVALPAQARATGGPEVPSYAFDGSAQRIRGAASSLDAKELKPGRTYRDSLEKDGKVHYRVNLDNERNTYVSVVAVPPPGGEVEYGDGFRVSIQDGSGAECSYQKVNFASAQYARPLAGYARRTVVPGSSTCQTEGAYYVLVERDSATASAPDDWELEIRHVTEPLLKQPGPTELPKTWASGTPAPPAGGQQQRQGGAGFHEAVALREGEWRADILPGQTLFYRVPVDWGQQLHASAELGSGVKGDLVSNALSLTLDNPALGFVEMETVSYTGKPATLVLDPLRPVAHENRTSYNVATSGMRFAGWYYLSATLSPKIAAEYGDAPVPLTLRVTVKGSPKGDPGYDGDPGAFTVTTGDREAAEKGTNAAPAETNGTMALVATVGIGTGTALLLVLGAWTLLARRRA
ncbi:hypothetical protein [Streptomyces sp. NPDC058872]|uniref:hypothetical protein n=1 Tax=Streptomyces sp. NPDC058872 TaxID=3346661 RepID=UPI0036C4389C